MERSGDLSCWGQDIAMAKKWVSLEIEVTVILSDFLRRRKTRLSLILRLMAFQI